MILRYPLALIFGIAFSVLLFWLMWRLIGAPIDVGELHQATRVEFTRMRQDSEVASKEQEKPQQDQPPPVPEIPQMAYTAGDVSANAVQLMTPNVDAMGAMQRMSMSAGSDRDIIPLVRINPDYPPRALSRSIEGFVIVQFTISATGSVKDVIVVSAEPPKIFDDAAVRAVSRWRYNPKIEEGVAVERVGVQTKISFKLEKQ